MDLIHFVPFVKEEVFVREKLWDIEIGERDFVHRGCIQNGYPFFLL